MKSSPHVGWVYLMRNKSMPGIVKIGYTMDDPWERANQLSDSTSVPSPFVVVYAQKTRYAKEVEADAHCQFQKRRINPNREFFSSDMVSGNEHVNDEGFENEFFSIMLKSCARIVAAKQRIIEAEEDLERVSIKENKELVEFDNKLITMMVNRSNALEDLEEKGAA